MNDSRRQAPGTQANQEPRLESYRVLSEILKELKDAPAALALSGAAIYGVVRIAHDAFYRELNLVAEEVGLTQATILGRAAIYIAIAAAAFAVSLVAIRAIRAVIELFPHSRWMSYAGFVAAFLTVGSPQILVVSRDFRLVGFLLHHWVASALAAAAFGALTWVITLRILRQRARPHEQVDLADVSGAPGTGTPRLWEGWLMLLSLGLLVLAVFWLANAYGEEEAQKVMVGRQPHHGTLQVLSVRADPVCLVWTNGEPPLPTSEIFMYLGVAGDTSVLYRYVGDNGHPVRIPSGQVILELARPDDGPPWKCP